MTLPRFLPVAFFATTFLTSALHAATPELSPSLREAGWKERSFSGNSEYSVVERGGIQAIQGYTDASASALYRGLKIDLRQTPYINWQWQITDVFDNPDERQKHGDDFPARVYVVHKKGPFPWNTLALNYVWSSGKTVGEHWGSAYTEKSHVVVLQTGAMKRGEWVVEKRNVVEDFKHFFGVDIQKIAGFAVMVDGDDTRSSTTTWFADIGFSYQ